MNSIDMFGFALGGALFAGILLFATIVFLDWVIEWSERKRRGPRP